MTFASLFKRKVKSVSETGTDIKPASCLGLPALNETLVTSSKIAKCKNKPHYDHHNQSISKKKLHKRLSSSKRDPVHFHERKLAQFRNDLSSKEAQDYMLASIYPLEKYITSEHETEKERYRNMFFKQCHPLEWAEENFETYSPTELSCMGLVNGTQNAASQEICPECSTANCKDCGIVGEHEIEVLVGFNERKDYLTTTQFVYQRFKSIHDLLREIQGLQRKDIDENHFKQMKTLFEDYVATQRPHRDLTQMTATDLFKCLKQEKRFSTYYDVIPTLLTRLTGRPKKIFTSKTMKDIDQISHNIDRLYDDVVKVVAPNRKAFFSTRYLTAKLLEQVGEHESIHFIYEMKCKLKIKLQDAIWDEIQRKIKNE